MTLNLGVCVGGGGGGGLLPIYYIVRMCVPNSYQVYINPLFLRKSI